MDVVGRDHNACLMGATLVRPRRRAREIKGLGTESPRKDRLLQALLLSGELKGAAMSGSGAEG